MIHMGVFGRPKFGCVSLREGVVLRVDLPWISISVEDGSPLTWKAGGMGAPYADFASAVRLHLLKGVKVEWITA